MHVSWVRVHVRSATIESIEILRSIVSFVCIYYPSTHLRQKGLSEISCCPEYERDLVYNMFMHDPIQNRIKFIF